MLQCEKNIKKYRVFYLELVLLEQQEISIQGDRVIGSSVKLVITTKNHQNVSTHSTSLHQKKSPKNYSRFLIEISIIKNLTTKKINDII